MRPHPLLPALGLAAIGLFAGACSSSAKSPAATGSAQTTIAGSPGPANAVTIKSFSFHPTPLTAHVGDTVTVTNHDDTTHTFTADDGSFDTGKLTAGASHPVTLAKAGTFAYHCAIHNYMTGVIQVTG